MNKVSNFQTVIISILLITVVFLVYSYQQIWEQNQKLSEQVSVLNSKLNKANALTQKIEQRMANLEEQLKPKYQDLIAQAKQ